MKRKLQIFVSSTFADLKAERQAAVEAILRAGHIPAGMELFSAGDKSQLETIYRWIDESDVYMLILGGRYGSVEPDSGKAYTQLEYEHAVSTGKRFFSVVLTEAAIESKARTEGTAAIERTRPLELERFRTVVMSRVCRLVNDEKDIKLAIHETLLEFLREYQFNGWVSAREIATAEDTAKEVARLSNENSELRAALMRLRDIADERGQSRPDLVLSRVYINCSPEKGRGPLPVRWVFSDIANDGNESFSTKEPLLSLSNIGTLSAKDVVVKWSFPIRDALEAIAAAAVGLSSPPIFELGNAGMLEQKSEKLGLILVPVHEDETFDFMMPASSGTGRTGIDVPYAYKLLIAAFEYVKMCQVKAGREQRMDSALPQMHVSLKYRDINNREYSTSYNIEMKMRSARIRSDAESTGMLVEFEGLLQPESVRT